MTYIVQNFVDGQTLTAEQLNYMERGIAAMSDTGKLADEIAIRVVSALGNEEVVGLLEGTVETFTIPNEAENLKSAPFAGCTQLKFISVSEDHPTLSVTDGVLYSKDGSTLIVYPSAKEAEEFALSPRVTSIAEKAFDGCCGIKSLIIHEGVTSCASDAFDGCDIAKIELHMNANTLNQGGAYPISLNGEVTVIIPEGATFIDAEVFKNLPNVTTVYVNGQCEMETWGYVMDSKGTTLQTSVFGGDLIPLKKLVFGEGVTSLPGNVCYDNKTLESVTIPSGVTVIPSNAFCRCALLNEVVLNESLETIEVNAFASCISLESITIPGSVTYIDSYAFSSSGLKTIRGYAGSYAETYAASKGIAFEVIAE